MPSLTSHLFCVLTFGHLGSPDLSEVPSRLLQWLTKKQAMRYILIEEKGESGTNPHLNLVYQVQEPVRTDLVRKSLQSQIYAKLFPDYKETSHDVKVRTVSNEATLIGGYLQKESDLKIHYNQGYDLEDLKRQSNYTKPIGLSKSYINVTPASAVPTIIDFANKYDMPYDTSDQILMIIAQMSISGYSFLKVLSSLRMIVVQVQSKVEQNPNIFYGELSDIFFRQGIK